MGSEFDSMEANKTATSFRRTAETVAVVLAWFALNISIASSTKWIFVDGNICIEGKGCKLFKFPITITIIHMLFSWFLCTIQIFYVRGGLKTKLTLSKQVQLIAPLSLCFALSVVMGNMSLKYIYPSFNQMLGAMSPLITVLLAVLLERKQFSLNTWVSMPVICIGLCLCSLKELNFNYLGAFFATGATVLRALKSIIQGRLLVSPDQKMDSVTLLYYMSPLSAVWLSLLGIFIEGTEPLALLFTGLFPDSDRRVTGGNYVLFLLTFSGLNACLLNLANFLVTSYTSPVTLQVLGNVKSCLSIAVSVAIFRNSLTSEQAVGVVTCLFGVWIYNQKGSGVCGFSFERKGRTAPDSLPKC
eukprot:TRINITY_DN47842_c0_g1_i1.p1 TRINITY_DN47842_c0_g1~~TRINITY_DN47842_c0_g1_i1.p1  ORF type:complete len:394 (+),score=59.22 TRINITY_DN47842_c0_g1_i1:111-1184(+)